jgi:hypothetical protein
MIALAHIAGMPVEETIASLGPALLLTFGAASATLRARLRPARSSAPAAQRRRDAASAARQMPDAQDEPRSARTARQIEAARQQPGPAARYRIDWDDCHSTVYTPAAGALRAAHLDAEPTR